MKKTLLIVFAFFLHQLEAQVVSIPDAKFKAALISAGVDQNKDGNIQVTEAKKTYYLSVNSLGITDLTGIEAFTQLEYLDCYENQLTTLNVTKNTLLNHLDCGSNKLSSIDVSKNALLSVFDCSYNFLNNLDISNNIELMSLRCNNNTIKSLNLEPNTTLKILVCANNQMDSINTDKNTNLTIVDIKNNVIDSVNFYKNTALTSIDCSFNNLRHLSVCNNVSLTFLDCNFNVAIDTVKVNAGHSALITAYPDNWVKPPDAVWYDGPCPVLVDTTDTIIGIEPIHLSQKPKRLTQVFNVLGQEVSPNQTANGGIFLFLYSDGTVEKRMVLRFND